MFHLSVFVFILGYGEREAAEATHQMLKAIHYMHSRAICHRDLKLENWMYSTQKGTLDFV